MKGLPAHSHDQDTGVGCVVSVSGHTHREYVYSSGIVHQTNQRVKA